MKLLRFVAIALIACAFSSQPVPESSVALGDNAALWYWRAFLLAEQLGADRTSELEQILETGGDGDKEVLDEALEEIGPVLKPFDTATRARLCKFGIDLEEGMNAKLPHLYLMRRCAKLLIARAKGCLEAGDVDDAVECIRQLLCAAEHLSSDDLLLSCLVAVSLFEAARALTEEALDGAKLDAVNRKAIREALARIDRGDPLRLRSHVVTEQTVTSKWMLREYGVPGGVARLCRHFPKVLDERVRALDDDGLLEQLRSFDEMMTELVHAFQAGDASTVERLSTYDGISQYGAIALIFGPAASDSVFEKTMEIRTKLADLDARLLGDTK